MHGRGRSREIYIREGDKLRADIKYALIIIAEKKEKNGRKGKQEQRGRKYIDVHLKHPRSPHRATSLDPENSSICGRK